MAAKQLLSTLDNIDLTQQGTKLAVTSFAALGAYYIGVNAYAVFKGFMKYMVLPRANLKARYGGGWALVTGASDGLGKQYSLELARSGFNIILMARDQTKIDAVAKEIKDTYGVETKSILYDFSKLASQESAQGLKDLLEAELKGVDVSILVNNVGCAKFGSLDTHTVWDSMRQINVNVNSQTYMSMFMLPRLIARESRSAMINVSSIVYYQPGGMVPVYSATKSYNYALSESIRDAHSDKLDVLTVCPGQTKTQMNSGRYCFSVTADSHAKAVINQLSWQKVTYGSVVHALQPRLKTIWPIGYIVNMVNAQRRAEWQAEEAAKKKEEEAGAKNDTPAEKKD